MDLLIGLWQTSIFNPLLLRISRQRQLINAVCSVSKSSLYGGLMIKNIGKNKDLTIGVIGPGSPTYPPTNFSTSNHPISSALGLLELSLCDGQIEYKTNKDLPIGTDIIPLTPISQQQSLVHQNRLYVTVNLR